MGTSESKYALDHVDAQQTNLCCDQNRKNSEERMKKKSRSKCRVGPNEQSCSIFKIRPEKNEAGQRDDVGLEKFEILQDSLTPAVLTENSLRFSKTIPTKQAAMPSTIPDGWTAAQLMNLNDSVHYTASVLRRKSPGFFAVQVDLVDYHLRDHKLCSFSQLIDDECTGSSARPQLSSRLG